MPSSEFPSPIKHIGGSVYDIAITNQDDSLKKEYSLDLTNLPLYSKNDRIYKSGDKWYVYNEWVEIEEYNNETITGEYYSSTGDLNIGSQIVYKLTTPIETEITDETVISQLEALYNTLAFDEVTNISVENPILSAELILDILYYQKTSLGLETKVSYEEYAKLLKRVEELESKIGG